MRAYDLFGGLAANVWKIIPYAHSRKIQLSEDAITTNLLLAIDAFLDNCVAVQDTRVTESTKGADWDFWIGNDMFGWYRYAVQAKKINPRTDRYEKFGHQVNGKPQIDILETYARANRAMALYCLFNFSKKTPPWHCAPPIEVEQLGCSVTPSWVIRQAMAKRGGRNFSAIHANPHTRPWRFLVSPTMAALPALQVLDPVWLWSDNSNHYTELPLTIQRLRELMDVTPIKVDFRDAFNPDVSLRPLWTTVIDIRNDTDEPY